MKDVALPYTIIGSLLAAVLVLLVRILVTQRLQRKRQRENRQETERLKSLVAAYHSLAGSFSPPAAEHHSQLEESLGDIVLFGALPQVELAADCARRLRAGEPVDYQPLADSLRAELRRQLGLDPIPDTIVLPDTGPGRPAKSGRDGEGGRNGRGGGGGGGEGAGGGGGGTGAMMGGLGAGVAISESAPDA